VSERTVRWRARLRRWRWWIAALVVLLLVRAAVPEVLRRVAMSQASQALNADVEIDDIDLALWHGDVILEGVALRPRAAAAPAQPADGTAEGAPTAAAPLIAFQRLAVSLHYWPLVSKTIQVRDIELDGPRVALDRLPSGDLNLAALIPHREVAVAAGATPGAAEPTPTDTAAPAAAGAPASSPWKFGLDRFVLRDGRVRFRDLKTEGSEPVELGIDQVMVQEIALSPAVYGQPARVHVKLGVDEGAITIAARLHLLDAGFGVDAEVKADRLPLRRARVYVPNVGWSDLKGELDLALAYELATGSAPKNALRGTIALRDIAVAVPQLEDVAASWERLGVTIKTIDLVAQRAEIAEVALSGARLDVRAHGGEPLPILARSAGAAPTAPPEPTPSAAPDAAAEPAPAAKPWEWGVESLRIADSAVIVLSDQPPFQVGIDLTASDLRGSGDTPARIALALSFPAGALTLDGALRLAPPAFGGRLQISDLALPPLVTLSGRIDPAILPGGILTTDLKIAAGLPATTDTAAAPDRLTVAGTLGLRDLRVVPPGDAAPAVDVTGLDLAIDELDVPGVVPIGTRAAPDAAVRVGAQLTLRGPRIQRSGASPLTAAAESVGLTVSDASIPAALAGLAPFESAQPLRAGIRLDVAAPRYTDDAAALAVQADTIALAITDASMTAVPPDAAPGSAPPVHAAATLSIAAPKLAIAQGRQLAVEADRIALDVPELTVPGIAVGAPATDTGQPLHTVATLNLGNVRVQRGDGKEFAIALQRVAVPLTELAATGVIAAGASPAHIRAAFGDVRIDAPAIRLTRTKEGMVLPVASASTTAAAAPAPRPVPAAPAASAAPAAPPQITLASVRVTNGSLDFSDRAVQPPYRSRLAPIEIEARNVHYPDPSVKPVRVDITTAEQGHIRLTGDIAPQGGELQLAISDLPLAPFTSYATAYSPYSISDGTLEITTTASYRGGSYDVANALTLHQLAIGGAEGESLFEQQFGVPLTMALALLRDASGDITLNVPVRVDQSGGAAVDTVGVVRTALRQALLGALESPLKLVGGVLGVGGGKTGVGAPAPIAFAVGRAQPTDAGQASAARLADFLASRPAMAVQLAAAPTADDVRWLREQALRAEWHDESFWQRSFGFLTQRGPRERIGAYLAARAAGTNPPALSSEDAATLQTWLDARPGPPPDALSGLAAARLTAVEAILHGRDIDAARVSHADPTAEPVEGPPVVTIAFRPRQALADAASGGGE
jgi:uncharacterized protein involved in outer membrane biogenesis